jgi:putative membrane protein
MTAFTLHAGWDGPGPWIGLAWLVIFATVAAFVIFRASRWRRYGMEHRGHGSAEAALAERFARGEITEDEFRRARAVLKESDS